MLTHAADDVNAFATPADIKRPTRRPENAAQAPVCLRNVFTTWPSETVLDLSWPGSSACAALASASPKGHRNQKRLHAIWCAASLTTSPVAPAAVRKTPTRDLERRTRAIGAASLARRPTPPSVRAGSATPPGSKLSSVCSARRSRNDSVANPAKMDAAVANAAPRMPSRSFATRSTSMAMLTKAATAVQRSGFAISPRAMDALCVVIHATCTGSTAIRMATYPKASGTTDAVDGVV
mmetsp:Transcript_8923/g.29489  ORF Transcript_8923/g.29489 Transcript_8923/m.29489 type:complete len:237 (+) Transcript_8923:326-1036(+)